MKKALLLILACVFLLSGCISIEFEEPSDGAVTIASGENTPATTVDVEEQIAVELVEYTFDGDRYAGALISNNSTEQIGELEIQFLFYDADGKIIGTESDGHDAILPGSTVVSFVSDMDVPQSYDRMDYKLSVDVEANSGYENHAAKVKIDTNVGDDCVILQITNNADVDIEELEYAVVFYKDGKVVDMGNGVDVYDIEAGDTVIEEYSSWGVDFDTYVVYLNQAHTFGW